MYQQLKVGKVYEKRNLLIYSKKDDKEYDLNEKDSQNLEGVFLYCKVQFYLSKKGPVIQKILKNPWKNYLMIGTLHPIPNSLHYFFYPLNELPYPKFFVQAHNIEFGNIPNDYEFHYFGANYTNWGANKPSPSAKIVIDFGKFEGDFNFKPQRNYDLKHQYLHYLQCSDKDLSILVKDRTLFLGTFMDQVIKCPDFFNNVQIRFPEDANRALNGDKVYFICNHPGPKKLEQQRGNKYIKYQGIVIKRLEDVYWFKYGIITNEDKSLDLQLIFNSNNVVDKSQNKLEVPKEKLQLNQEKSQQEEIKQEQKKDEQKQEEAKLNLKQDDPKHQEEVKQEQQKVETKEPNQQLAQIPSLVKKRSLQHKQFYFASSNKSDEKFICVEKIDGNQIAYSPYQPDFENNFYIAGFLVWPRLSVYPFAKILRKHAPISKDQLILNIIQENHLTYEDFNPNVNEYVSKHFFEKTAQTDEDKPTNCEIPQQPLVKHADNVLSISEQILEQLKLRTDFTSANIFSIDCENTGAIDDSMSIRQLGQDQYEVAVHIADPSFFVNQYSILDQAAAQRMMSQYVADQMISSMLPKELYFNYCSILEGKLRLAISVVFIMNADGIFDPKSVQIKPSVIKNSHKLSYKQTDEQIEKLLKDSNDTSVDNIFRDILILYKIALKREQMKSEIGLCEIQFNDLQEAKLKSEILVQEFMVLTNSLALNFLQTKRQEIRTQSQKYLKENYEQRKQQNESITQESLDEMLQEIILVKKKSITYLENHLNLDNKESSKSQNSNSLAEDDTLKIEENDKVEEQLSIGNIEEDEEQKESNQNEFLQNLDIEKLNEESMTDEEKQKKFIENQLNEEENSITKTIFQVEKSLECFEQLKNQKISINKNILLLDDPNILIAREDYYSAQKTANYVNMVFEDLGLAPLNLESQTEFIKSIKSILDMKNINVVVRRFILFKLIVSKKYLDLIVQYNEQQRQIAQQKLEEQNNIKILEQVSADCKLSVNAAEQTKNAADKKPEGVVQVQQEQVQSVKSQDSNPAKQIPNIEQKNEKIEIIAQKEGQGEKKELNVIQKEEQKQDEAKISEVKQTTEQLDPKESAKQYNLQLYENYFKLTQIQRFTFTSPIRKYGDILLHRLIKLALAIEKIDNPIKYQREEIRLNQIYFKNLQKFYVDCITKERIKPAQKKADRQIQLVKLIEQIYYQKQGENQKIEETKSNNTDNVEKKQESSQDKTNAFNTILDVLVLKNVRNKLVIFDPQIRQEHDVELTQWNKKFVKDIKKYNIIEVEYELANKFPLDIQYKITQIKYQVSDAQTLMEYKKSIPKDQVGIKKQNFKTRYVYVKKDSQNSEVLPKEQEKSTSINSNVDVNKTVSQNDVQNNIQEQKK